MNFVRSRILLVDDDENFLASNARVLGRQWNVITASSGEAGLKALDQEGPFAVVVSDFNMPRMDGTRFLAKVREKSPDTVRMMLTGEGDFQIATQAVNEGNIFRFLTKPCPQTVLSIALDAGLIQYRLIQAEKDARQQEVRIASQIQQSLLLDPPPTGIRGVQIASLTIPSSGADGDFIDFFEYSGTCFDVVLGDVMGKGVSAALIGAATKSRFSRILSRLFSAERIRAFAEVAKGVPVDATKPVNGVGSLGSAPDPELIMMQMQQEMGTRLFELGSFVTLNYSRFDILAQRMTYVDAGHMPTILVSGADGVARRLKGMGSPLGFPDSEPFVEISVDFRPGDVFLFYSDGLMEGSPPGGKFFGISRIEEAVVRHRGETASRILNLLFEEFKAFVKRAEFSDDVSCVVVKIESARERDTV
ncbi:MAG: SpoIIE family protein phosphatase [Candidatus Ozemobacteraceae bacterium]